MRVPDALATSAIRISLDEENTMAEAQAFERAFDKVHAEFQKLAPAK
jgi:cysteine desulfurase